MKRLISGLVLVISLFTCCGCTQEVISPISGAAGRLIEDDFALYGNGGIIAQSPLESGGQFLFSDLTADTKVDIHPATKRNIGIGSPFSALASAYRGIPCVVISDYGKDYCASIDDMLREYSLVTNSDEIPGLFIVSFSQRFKDGEPISEAEYAEYLDQSGGIDAYVLAFEVTDNIVTDIIIKKD